MSKIDIANVVRVTLLAALRGISSINTSALALITDDVPIPGDYGTSRVYLNPTGVAEDFGSNSDTYALALAIFNQTPNILTGGGFLVVIPRDAAAAASAATILSRTFVDLTQLTASDYNIKAGVDGAAPADLLIGSVDTTSLATAVADLNSVAVAAAGMTFSLSGEVTACRVTLVSDTTGALSELELVAASTGTDIAPILDIDLLTALGSAAGLESIKDTILRTYQSVDYFGICYTVKMTDDALNEVAPLVQSIDKIQFVASSTVGDIAGIFTDILDAGYNQTRCLYYSTAIEDALEMCAAYAGRGLSTNFDGSNTASTMHLKDLTGILADEGITQTILDNAKAAGVDLYVDFGVPKVFTSGANQYFDYVYSNIALKVRLQAAGFNYLATTNTKIPQTEDGMNGLKGAYRQVIEKFVTNGTYAPGVWNSATKFGDPNDHVRNIAEKGYYIYSLPISDQTQAERDARIAPLVQIAAKSSGAIHSTDVVVFVEA